MKNVYFLATAPQKNSVLTTNIDILTSILHKNIYCGYSLEAPLWDSASEYT